MPGGLWHTAIHDSRRQPRSGGRACEVKDLRVRAYRPTAKLKGPRLSKHFVESIQASTSSQLAPITNYPKDPQKCRRVFGVEALL